MKPILVKTRVKVERRYRKIDRIPLRTECLLSVREDGRVSVSLSRGGFLLWLGLQRQFVHVGFLGDEAQEKISRYLKAGCSYRAWVADLPFPYSDASQSFDLSVWMDTK